MLSPFKFDSELRQSVQDALKECEEAISEHKNNVLIITEDMDDSVKKDIECVKLMRKLIQIKKIIYTNLLNDGKKIIYPLLLSKYDELLNEIYYIVGDLVNMDVATMDDYMFYCKKSKETRNFLKKICEFGEQHSD